MRVLVADDHVSVRAAVKTILRFEDDIEIVGEARDGPEAVRLARQLNPDTLVLDNWMPGLSGLDVARQLSHQLPDMNIVFHTLDRQIDELARAAGAHAVVLKDAPPGELVRAIRSVANRSRRRSVGRRERDRLYVDAVLVLSSAIEAKETGGALDRSGLAEAARRLAARLGQNEPEAERVQLGFLLRDIGKVAVPEAILIKREALLPAERELLQAHAVLGADILAGVETLRDVAPIVRHHHERFDGSGYPDGLQGEQIPLGAQIVGLLDAFNAIASARAYKSTFPADFVFQQLALGAGRLFAMRLVGVFVELYQADPSALIGGTVPPSLVSRPAS